MPIPKTPLYMMGMLEHYHYWWWRKNAESQNFVNDWNAKQKAIFVHIPKTAGTSIRRFIGMQDVSDTHAPALSYYQQDPELFEEAFLFTFVRNPWDRFASSFHFLKTGTVWPMQQKWADENMGDMDFDQFTRKLRQPLFRAKVKAERFFWPQSFWFKHTEHLRDFDRIYRFERLDEAFADLSKRFGGPNGTQIPHERKVERAPYTAIYTDQTREIVSNLYADDIDRFVYAFGE